MEASWSPCLPREGRWDLLFVQICEAPQPCSAHKKCVMKPGRTRCTVQLPAAGLELITAQLLHALSPRGGRPCLALITAMLQSSPFSASGLAFTWILSTLTLTHPTSPWTHGLSLPLGASAAPTVLTGVWLRPWSREVLDPIPDPAQLSWDRQVGFS